MSVVGKALYARMSAHAGLSALVADRIYPERRPQSAALPAIVYLNPATPPRPSAMGSDTGLAEPLVQVSCWAKEAGGKSAFENAQDVATQVRAALQRFRGTAGGVEVLDCYVEDEGDLEDPESRDLQGVRLDFRVWIRE